MTRRTALRLGGATAAVLLTGCTSSPSATGSTTVTGSTITSASRTPGTSTAPSSTVGRGSVSVGPSSSAPVTSPSVAPSGWLAPILWQRDLDQLDSTIRARHPAPWVNHPESEWKAGLAELRERLPGLSQTDATLALIRQVALLDSDSGIFPDEAGFHQCAAFLQEFADGLFVVAAKDETLAGARVTSIGGVPTAALLTAVTPYVNADNDSARQEGRPWMLMQMQILQALGAAPDPTRARFAVVLPNGSSRTVDVPIMYPSQYDAIFQAQPWSRTPLSWQAVHATKTTSRINHGAIVLLLTDLGQDATAAIRAMQAAVSTGQAKRVVLDQRYCQGGDYDSGQKLRTALASLEVPLTVVTGAANVGASGAQASWLKKNTAARFVGQAPGSNPNAFLDDDAFTLLFSNLVVHFPHKRLMSFPETLRSLPMNTVVDERGADFFAGVDRTLQAALA